MRQNYMAIRLCQVVLYLPKHWVPFCDTKAMYKSRSERSQGAEQIEAEKIGKYVSTFTHTGPNALVLKSKQPNTHVLS